MVSVRQCCVLRVRGWHHSVAICECLTNHLTNLFHVCVYTAASTVCIHVYVMLIDLCVSECAHVCTCVQYIHFVLYLHCTDLWVCIVCFCMGLFFCCFFVFTAAFVCFCSYVCIICTLCLHARICLFFRMCANVYVLISQVNITTTTRNFDVFIFVYGVLWVCVHVLSGHMCVFTACAYYMIRLWYD